MDILFHTYPELAEAIDRVCDSASWAVTGASALIFAENGDLLLELTKPKHWQATPDGRTIIGLGGIGGSLEPGETILDCLYREAKEELGQDIRVLSADTTWLVYEERLTKRLSLPSRGQPRPTLCTISANLYRQDDLPGAEILVIATYLAYLKGQPELGDLWGLLQVPARTIGDFLGHDTFDADDLRELGIQSYTREPLPRHGLLQAVWTGRSLQVLLQNEVIELTHLLKGAP